MRSRFFLRRFYIETTLIHESSRLLGWLTRTSRLGYIFDRCKDNKTSVEVASADFDKLNDLARARMEVIDMRLRRVRAMKDPASIESE